MDTLDKLKEYIQQELIQVSGNKGELTKNKEQLSLLISEIDNLFVNNELDSFDGIFQKYNFSISFDKLKDAISLISYFNQLNATNVSQYQDITRDLSRLKNEINDIIEDINDKISIIENNQEKIIILENCLSILNNNENDYIFSKEEIEQLFKVIKILPLDLKEKYELLFDITSHNIENKLARKIENEIATDSEVSMNIDENIQGINEILDANDEIDDSIAGIENEEVVNETNVETDFLLEKIKKLVDYLSKFYEVRSFSEIDNETEILARKEIYASNNEISKYNWPLIYADLYNNLIPKYENGENIEEIRNVFEFVIGIYENYESIYPEFDDSEILDIKNYINMINDKDEKYINHLYNILETFIANGEETINLSEVLGKNVPWTNDEIILYHKIIELKDAYGMYLQERSGEVKNRFSPELANILVNIKDCKELIKEFLEEIKSKQSEINISHNEEPSEILDDSEQDVNDDDMVHLLEKDDISNLVIFMDDVSERDDIMNLFYKAAKYGNLSDIIKCIYKNIYMFENYNSDLNKNRSQYRKLKDKDDYRSLEKNDMCRVRQRDIRCSYRLLHVSEKNKAIVQKLYPSFNGTLFLVTGIYYKSGDSDEYIAETNRLVNTYQSKIDHYIKLFSEDITNEEQLSEALDLIDKSLEKYNKMCSLIKEDKLSKKAGGN